MRSDGIHLVAKCLKKNTSMVKSLESGHTGIQMVKNSTKNIIMMMWSLAIKISNIRESHKTLIFLKNINSILGEIKNV
jgi:hypothetical protein